MDQRSVAICNGLCTIFLGGTLLGGLVLSLESAVFSVFLLTPLSKFPGTRRIIIPLQFFFHSLRPRFFGNLNKDPSFDLSFSIQAFVHSAGSTSGLEDVPIQNVMAIQSSSAM